MVPVVSLWLPILVAAVFAFLASSVLHMATSFHKNDVKKLPDEEAVRAALRPLNLSPGDYAMPVPDGPSGLNAPEFQKKMADGPVAFITIRPNGPVAMGRSLMQWFLFLLVVAVFTAYVTGLAHGPGTEYLRIFQVAGCVSFMGYGLGAVPNSIWWGRDWGMTVRSLIGSLLYGLLTGGTFGWLWPR